MTRPAQIHIQESALEADEQLEEQGPYRPSQSWLTDAERRAASLWVARGLKEALGSGLEKRYKAAQSRRLYGGMGGNFRMDGHLDDRAVRFERER